MFGFAVGYALPRCVLDDLTGERVLYLRGRNGDAVWAEREVNQILVLCAVMKLPREREPVCRVGAAACPDSWREPARKTRRE